MVIGIGCDIIEIERVRKALARPGFKERVFTTAEIAYCDAHGKKAAESYAARFAAKEAVLKALGTGLRQGEIREIGVVSDALGKPSLELTGYHAEFAHKLGVQRLHVTLSHSRELATAYVLLEGKDE